MFRHGVALVSVLALFSGEAFAQAEKQPEAKKATATKPDAPKAPAAPPPKASNAEDSPAAAASTLGVPDNFKLNMMIRSIVIAVNQANKTNNYTVLRDLSSPDFRIANSAEKLAQVFSGLRQSGFDLSPVLFFTPKLLKPPAVNEDGMLRLHGFFDTRPQIVVFDLLYQSVDGEWRLFGISISTRPVPAETPSAAGNSAADAKTTAPEDLTKQDAPGKPGGR